MKRMKKLVASLLAVLSVVASSVGLTACTIKGFGSGSGKNSGSDAGDNSSSVETSSSVEDSSSVTSEAPQPKGVVYEIVDDTAQVVDYDGSETSVTIEATYEGVAVTKIGDEAFKNSTITSIEIPDSVTVIGNSAFYGCADLTAVVIPDGVESIGDRAFQDCNGLVEVVIPDSVTSIGASAFEMCLGLKSVVIGKNVTSIGDGLFDYSSCLSSITFNGTKKQWKAIEKNNTNWTFILATKVVCSDGEVDL